MSFNGLELELERKRQVTVRQTKNDIKGAIVMNYKRLVIGSERNCLSDDTSSFS